MSKTKFYPAALAVLALLWAAPAWAGWQDEFRAGMQEARSGRYSTGAEKAYTALLQDGVPQEDRGKGMILLMNMLFQMDMDDEANRLLNKALKEDKANDDIYYFCLGAMHERSWQFGPAVEDYNNSLKRNADNVSSLMALARLRISCPEDQYVDRKAAVELATRANKAAQNDPAKTMSYLLIARAQASLGNFSEAAAAQRAALKAGADTLQPDQVDQIKVVLQEFERRAKRKQ